MKLKKMMLSLASLFAVIQLFQACGEVSYVPPEVSTVASSQGGPVDQPGSSTMPPGTSPQPSSMKPILIKSGSRTDYTTASGVVFEADKYYRGGNPITRSPNLTIQGTADPAMYRTLREDDFSSISYGIPVANGSYKVKLYFAETSGNASPGYRRFNVLIEGQMAMRDLDVFSRAGGLYKALTLTFDAVVTDGQLDLQLTSDYDAPFLNALEIYQ